VYTEKFNSGLGLRRRVRRRVGGVDIFSFGPEYFELDCVFLVVVT
jgi:hypothetical protein